MARTSRTGTRTDLALLGVALVLAIAALILPSGVRSRVQSALRSSVAAPLVSAQAWAERGRQAIVDHGRLVNSVDSLALGSQSIEPLRSENDRLRALLGLGQRLQWGFVATEVIHSRQDGDEHTVLLAAGSAAGVRPFSPLVVPEGLVGMVRDVDARSSTAILWTHADFRASATTTDGLAFGIVAAHLGTGADRYLLEMRGVPFRSALKPGTLIVTSGLGNVFPQGVPIGAVLRETKTIEGWARTYLIRPIVSPDAATAAMILLPPRAAAGVTGAWSSVTAAENTQKAIAVAGDSIIADSVRVIQERLAKLALLDSLRRAAIYRGDSGVRVESDTSTGPPVEDARAATMPATLPATLPVAPKPASPAPAAPRSSVTQPAPSGVPAATVPARAKPATATASTGSPPPVRPRTPATARADSLARAAVRARAADSVRAKSVADSAQARNGSQPKAPENPFRLPPDGGPA